MSGSLWSHELQHSRLPCPSLSPWDCSGSGPLSQWCHPTSHPLSPTLLLLSVFPSSVFSNELVLCIGWPKCWSLSISPSNEYSQLISFRMDWFDLLAAQGTSNSLLQYHSSKASMLQHSAFLVQLSHPYMTIGKNKCLTWVWADFKA